MNTNTNTNKEEQILIRITGNDRPRSDRFRNGNTRQ